MINNLAGLHQDTGPFRSCSGKKEKMSLKGHLMSLSKYVALQTSSNQYHQYVWSLRELLCDVSSVQRQGIHCSFTSGHRTAIVKNLHYFTDAKSSIVMSNFIVIELYIDVDQQLCRQCVAGLAPGYQLP